MCNPNKGFKNCKPNPKVTQRRPQSLNEFIDRFCRHQLIHGVATCKHCGGAANCTAAVSCEGGVIGTFVCVTCKTTREMVVTPGALRAAYDKLLGESQ